ncbi:MAG: peptidylprolyl isomerase [Candidatus Omnitrophica bacterium]|nr:peptidylprolyl isomerase [Candidatus Omnitrophota bacterium]
MLAIIRGKHAKKILWIVAIAIIVVFVLSGAQSFLRQKRAPVIAEIGNQKIPITNFTYYIELARLDFILYSNLRSESKAITPEEIMEKAKVYFSLLWKAKEKKIKVNDKEIIEWVNRNFTRGGKFDEASYTRYINHISRAFNISLTPRSFEEYIREFIVMDKLWKEVIHATITDEEVRRLHEIDTQEAKIAYLFIPYQKFRVDIGISPKEIEEYYKNNKSLFKREAKINIKYALIGQSSQLDDQELSELSKLKTLDDLREYLSKKEKTSLEIKETGFIGLDDPVNEIGWHPAITQKAFSLAVNQISEPIKLEKGLIIVGKEEEKPAIIPALGEIEGEVKEALIVTRAKEEAKKFTQEILNEISKKEVKDLSKAVSHIDWAGKENIEFKETEYFKYNDYIEGVGLNRMVSAVIFSLEKNEIYSKIIPLKKGAYILQLKDKTLFDEESFEAKKQTYRDNIKAQKEFIERLKFLGSLAQEIVVTIPIK